MKYNKILAHILLFALLVFAFPAYSSDEMWYETKETKMRLLVAGQDVEVDKQLYKAFIQLEFSEGWYSYWRFPGDAGIPLSVTPEENSGIVSAKIQWPVPKRYEAYGLVSYIYDQKTTLPVTFELSEDFDSNADYTRNVKVFFMVCKFACVPQEFVVTVPKFNAADTSKLGRNQSMLRLAERHLPHDGDVSALKIDFAVVSKDALVLAVKAGAGFEGTDVYIDAGAAATLTQKPEIELQDGKTGVAMIKIKALEGVEDLNADLLGKTIHVVLKNRNKAIQREFSF